MMLKNAEKVFDGSFEAETFESDQERLDAVQAAPRVVAEAIAGASARPRRGHNAVARDEPRHRVVRHRLAYASA